MRVCGCVSISRGTVGSSVPCSLEFLTSLCVCLQEDLAAAYFLLSSTVKSFREPFIFPAPLYTIPDSVGHVQRKARGRDEERFVVRGQQMQTPVPQMEKQEKKNVSHPSLMASEARSEVLLRFYSSGSWGEAAHNRSVNSKYSKTT